MSEIESSLQKWFIESLRELGFFVFRHNTMNASANRRFARVKKEELGVPDVIACYKGMFVGFEMKQKGKPLSQEQELRRAEIVKAGGIFFRIDSREEALRVITILQEWI
jgi:Holliday junction resolvase